MSDFVEQNESKTLSENSDEIINPLNVTVTPTPLDNIDIPVDTNFENIKELSSILKKRLSYFQNIIRRPSLYHIDKKNFIIVKDKFKDIFNQYLTDIIKQISTASFHLNDTDFIQLIKKNIENILNKYKINKINNINKKIFEDIFGDIFDKKFDEKINEGISEKIIKKVKSDKYDSKYDSNSSRINSFIDELNLLLYTALNNKISEIKQNINTKVITDKINEFLNSDSIKSFETKLNELKILIDKFDNFIKFTTNKPLKELIENTFKYYYKKEENNIFRGPFKIATIIEGPYGFFDVLLNKNNRLESYIKKNGDFIPEIFINDNRTFYVNKYDVIKTNFNNFLETKIINISLDNIELIFDTNDEETIKKLIKEIDSLIKEIDEKPLETSDVFTTSEQNGIENITEEKESSSSSESDSSSGSGSESDSSSGSESDSSSDNGSRSRSSSESSSNSDDSSSSSIRSSSSDKGELLERQGGKKSHHKNSQSNKKTKKNSRESKKTTKRSKK